MVKLQSIFARMASSLIDRALKKHLSSIGVVLVLVGLVWFAGAIERSPKDRNLWSSALACGLMLCGSVAIVISEILSRKRNTH